MNGHQSQQQQSNTTTPGSKPDNLQRDNLSPGSKTPNLTGRAGFVPRSLSGAASEEAETLSASEILQMMKIDYKSINQAKSGEEEEETMPVEVDRSTAGMSGGSDEGTLSTVQPTNPTDPANKKDCPTDDCPDEKENEELDPDILKQQHLMEKSTTSMHSSVDDARMRHELRMAGKKNASKPLIKALNTQQAGHIEATTVEKAKSASSGSTINALMSTLMQMMSLYLGPTKGSKLTGSIKLEIPVATGIDITLGMEAEQERKDDKTRIANKLKGSAGIAVDVKIGEGTAEFGMFLGAESGNFDTSAQLLSYGFYKSGRVAADLLNDWKGAASGGLPASVALYYGLTYMYANSQGLDDQIRDHTGAEENVAEMEKELFGISKAGITEEGNQNEVTYGGEAKLGLDVGDGLATAGLEAALSTKINQQTLMNSGVMGAQKDPGFLRDYEVGGDNEFSLKLAGTFNTGKLSGSRELVATFDNKNRTFSSGALDSSSSGWQFQKLEHSVAVGFEGMAALKLTSREVIQHIIQEAVGYYNEHKNIASIKDKSATPKDMDSRYVADNLSKRVTSAMAQISTAGVMDAAGFVNNDSGAIKTTDKLEAGIKITAIKNGKPELEFQVRRVTNITADAKLVEGEIVDFTPILTMVFKAK